MTRTAAAATPLSHRRAGRVTVDHLKPFCQVGQGTGNSRESKNRQTFQTCYNGVRCGGLDTATYGSTSRRLDHRDHPVPMSAARTPWILRVVLVGLSVCVVLVLLELGLRIFWVKQLALGAGIEHPHFHHRLKPFTPYHFTSSEFDVTVRTNRYGLRGEAPIIPKPTGVFRILMLGDSYTFGFPVEDEQTFTSLTERGLQARGYPVETVNGGVSGSSPTLHYISLRDQFLTFEPDLVILWYDLGDLMEDYMFQKNLLYDDQGNILRCDPQYIHGQFSYWKWAHNHSALVRYLNTKVFRTANKIKILGWRDYLKAKLRGERSKVAIARLKRSQWAEDVPLYDKFLLVREDVTPERLAPYWKLSMTYLTMIHDLLSARGIPFVVGIYPYGMLAGPAQWADGRVYWGFEKGRMYQADAFVTLIEQFAKTHEIPFINSFESFRQAAQHEQLFYPEDGHFTPAGHRVLAAHLQQDRQFLTLLNSRTSQR